MPYSGGIARQELIVNGRVVQRVTGSAARFPVQTWTYGKTMVVRVRAYDRAGNTSLTPARTWSR